jgi:hypothetical protein
MGPITMNPAIFSIIGLILGASLQYFFTRHLDNQKHRRETRTTAYTDYLKCVSEQANLGKQRQSHEGRELGAKTADAKCRICLYGSSSAVETFAEFERLGAAMNTPEQCGAFTRMVAVMRKDSVGGRHIDLGDLEAVLLGVSSHHPTTGVVR